MANLIFEENEISDKILQFVKGVLENRGYTNNKVLIKPVGQLGDNYVADIKRFIVIEEDGENFQMIAKLAPSLERLYKCMRIEVPFKNEEVMYTEVLPRFVDLQKNAGVSETNVLKYAKCYGAYMEPLNDTILFEDLSKYNYVMMDRHKSLSDDSMKMILKEMAILHSLSYALKDNDHVVFKQLTRKLKNYTTVVMAESSDHKKLVNYLSSDIVGLLTSERYKKEVKGALDNFLELCKVHDINDVVSEYSVILHGDLWTNNIMFIINDGVPASCIFIDYQMAKLGNPVVDLFYPIFVSTSYDIRSKYFYDWIDYYYSELDKSLENFGLKASKIYPREQLDSDMKTHGKFLLGFSILVLSFTVRQSSDAFDLKSEIPENDEHFDQMINKQRISWLPEPTLRKFINSVEGLLKSFEEYGFL